MDNQKIYNQKKRVTLIGTAVNLVLSLIKYIVGVISGSSALIADATHSVSDYITDIVVLIGLKLSSKPADSDHPYGHGKIESFSTMGVGLALFAAGGFLIYEGVHSLVNLYYGQSSLSADYYWAFIAAVVSIISKEWLYRYTIYQGKKLNSSSLIANAYHHRSDSYSSIGVLIGISCTLLSSDLAFMDPLSGIIVAFFIIYMGWKIIKPSFLVLVDTVIDEKELEEISAIAEKTPGVVGTDKVRKRSVGNDAIVDMEIYVDRTLTLDQAHAISETVKKNIIGAFTIVKEVLIHVEPAKNQSNCSLLKEIKVFKQVKSCVEEMTDIQDLKDIRCHYILGGVEVNLDIVVNPNISVKKGHDIAERLEKKLTGIANIKFVHIHIESE